jgi:hypothetical protein
LIPESDSVNTWMEEPEKKTNKVKVIVLLIITIVCGVFLFRIYNTPQLNITTISITENISQSDILSTKLIVTKETRISNSTLDLFNWIVLGKVNYIEKESKLLNSTVTSFTTWEDLQNDK